MAPEPESQPIAVVERALSPRLVLFHHPASREAEQFRGLRNTILAMNPDRAPRSVALCGALTGEGVTVTAANLAMALAEIGGNRVLLIDANLREPGIESLLGLPQGPGLSELLADRISLERALRKTILKNVDVLTAGRPHESPAELLALGRFKTVLDALKPAYNYILIDTAAANDYTDASLVARDCDGVVMVVRIDMAPKVAVEQSIVQLRSLGANLLGAFLVGTPPGSGKLEPIQG